MNKKTKEGYKIFKDSKKKLLRNLKRLRYLEKRGQEFVLNKIRREQLFNTIISAFKGALMAIGRVNEEASIEEIIQNLYDLDKSLGQYLEYTYIDLYTEPEDIKVSYYPIDAYIHYYEVALAILDIIEKKYLRTVRDTSSPEPTH